MSTAPGLDAMGQPVALVIRAATRAVSLSPALQSMTDWDFVGSVLPLLEKARMVPLNPGRVKVETKRTGVTASYRLFGFRESKGSAGKACVVDWSTYS